VSDWQIIAMSIKGETHVRKHLPNQDALSWAPTEGPGPVVLTIADGHGSPRTFRSDLGARFAVSVATRLTYEFVTADEQRGLPAAELRARAESALPGRILAEWLARVRDDVETDPFSAGELAAAAAARGRAAIAGDELAYGATLLVAAASETQLLFLQLGDGDILTVTPGGEVTRPIPPDPTLIAEETTSLCTPDAEREFRIEALDVANGGPELVVVSTDGYSKAFVDEESFLKVGSDIVEQLHANGRAWVDAHLEEWLTIASREGSGDDITAGLLWRPMQQ
jgi:hypothetical protein